MNKDTKNHHLEETKDDEEIFVRGATDRDPDKPMLTIPIPEVVGRFS